MSKKEMQRNKKLVSYFNEQAGACAYCHEQMTLKLGQPNTATIDHVIPRSQGGKKKDFNEVAACFDCNRLKSNRPVAVFMRTHLGWLETLKREAVEDNIIPFPDPEKPRVA